MKTLNRIPVWIGFIVSILFGLIIGMLWNDIPGIIFNNELKLYEVFNLILTLSLGLIIPFMIKKWIDDNRSVKIFLVDEIKNMISSLNKIENIITNSRNNNSFSQNNKDEIIFLFHKIDLQLNSFNEQLHLAFPSFSNSLIRELKEKYFNYERFLTGGEMMLSSFTNVDNKFYKEHCTEFSKIETHLKIIVHKIHKF